MVSVVDRCPSVSPSRFELTDAGKMLFVKMSQ